MKSTEELNALRDELKAKGVKYCVGAYVDIHGVPKGKFVPIDHFVHFAEGSELYTGMAYYSWAPIFNSYGKNKRTNALRVPRGGGRVEARNADAACNPCLAATLVLAAGLEGIREKIDPGKAQEENLYEYTPEQLAAAGIEELPRTLDEAFKAFAADPFITKVLGQELRDEFITYKAEEWRQYHQTVSQWEVDRCARLF